MCLRRKPRRKMFTYYSISQVGYVLLAIGLGGQLVARSVHPSAAALAVIGGIFHLVNLSVFNALLFLDAGIDENLRSLAVARVKNTGGFSLGTVAGTMSMAGVPPLSGAVSKLMIITSFFMAGYYFIGTVALATSLLTLFSLWKFKGENFFNLRRLLPDSKAPLLMKIPVVLLTVLSFLMALLILPGVRDRVLEPAYDSLLHYQFSGVESDFDEE